jgi:hypothetical protein
MLFAAEGLLRVVGNRTNSVDVIPNRTEAEEFGQWRRSQASTTIFRYAMGAEARPMLGSWTVREVPEVRNATLRGKTGDNPDSEGANNEDNLGCARFMTLVKTDVPDRSMRAISGMPCR